MSREYDVVLFGATGFTGRLTARYLAEHAPGELKWALAGRNLAKLETVRDSAHTKVPLLTADIEDPASVEELAGATRVLVNAAGPYLKYGEPVVAACAGAGTDYLDLTGETEFVDTMFVKYHERAVRSGARILHACGFESIPYDLGVLFTVRQLPEDVPLRVTGLVRAGGLPSGGTLSSALNVFSRGPQMLRARQDRRRAEVRPVGRKVRVATGRIHREQGFWTLPLPTIDPQIVVRSAAALPEYGPDFTYRHYAALKRLPTVGASLAGAGALVAAAQVRPLRRALQKRWQPGDGPSLERRGKSWFKVRFVGEGGGRRVLTEVAGGDPGYEETAKMLGEAALCLALDDVPPVAGQVTTAVAMGDALTQRLVDAGITFRVLSSEDY